MENLFANFVVQDNYIIVFLTLAVAQIVAAIGWAVNVNVKLKELGLRSDRLDTETQEIKNKQNGTEQLIHDMYTKVSVLAESHNNLTTMFKEVRDDLRKQYEK